MERTPNKSVGLIRIPQTTENSLLPGSIEISESPVSKPRNYAEFPTEETFNLRSLNSPNTASSLKETFYDRLKDAVLHNRLSETLRHIRTDSESKAAIGETVEHGMTLTTEPHELTTDPQVPTLIWCAYCKGERATEIQYVNSSKTFWAAIGIFLAGGVAGCCLAPYCTNKCKAVQIACSKCGRTMFIDN